MGQAVEQLATGGQKQKPSGTLSRRATGIQSSGDNSMGSGTLIRDTIAILGRIGAASRYVEQHAKNAR